MKLKKINYLKYPLEIVIIFLVVFSTKASSFKTENYSSNENVNKSVNLSTMSLFISKEEALRKEQERKALEAKEKEKTLQRYLYDSLDSYTGDLTGYGADCPLCTGRLACKSSLDLSGGRNTYKDKTYGTVNIVASSQNLPCGTIIRFNNKR